MKMFQIYLLIAILVVVSSIAVYLVTRKSQSDEIPPVVGVGNKIPDL